MKIQLKSTMPYMASLSALPTEPMLVLSTKKVMFASGEQTFFVVKDVYNQSTDVPERFVDIIENDQPKTSTMADVISFAAQVQVGTVINANGQLLVIDSITNKSFRGYHKTWFEKSGVKEFGLIQFETLLNPHYFKTLSIIK